MNPFVEEILEKTAAATGLEVGVLAGLLSVPPDETLGDYAIPCFSLAKRLRKNPVEIAREVAGKVAPLLTDGERIAGVSAREGNARRANDRDFPEFGHYALPSSLARIGPPRNGAKPVP